MSEEQNERKIEVFESSIFSKKLSKLPDNVIAVIEDEIDLVIKDPSIGIQKKGDLAYLWVHKFKVDGQEVLLGYNWQEKRLTLHWLNIGSHENCYRESKTRRKADLKFIK